MATWNFCDNSKWREDFPAIRVRQDLIFADNAATTQKPQSVIEAMTKLWETGIMAIDRSNCQLAQDQGRLLELAQQQVATFFNAKSEELIVTKSATEALNLTAINLSKIVPEGKIILGANNHSSNLAPWLLHFREDQLIFLPFTDQGQLDVSKLKELLINEDIRVISLSLISNVLGTLEDFKTIVQLTKQLQKKRQQPIYLVLDAAAAVRSVTMNFERCGADFMIVSGHKMYGPMIAGVLVRKEILMAGKFVSYLVGGGNVEAINQFENNLKYRLVCDHKRQFRSGVTDLVSIVGWAAACEWSKKMQSEKYLYLADLNQYLMTKLEQLSGVKFLGNNHKKHLVSFYLEDYITRDVMAYLAANGVCAREGQHCAQGVYQQLDLTSSIRISLAIYNTYQEVEKIITLLRQIPAVLSCQH